MSHGQDGDRGHAGGLSHPRRDLDDLLTHAVRFSIVAALAGVANAEFAAVRDSVEISDAMLSKQAALLEKAGYAHLEKGARRPATAYVAVTVRRREGGVREARRGAASYR